MQRLIRSAGTLVLFTAAITGAGAQGRAGGDTYPDRPIRLIVNAPTAGAVDIVGRIIANKLAAQIHQQVVVDNRAGAGGLIGAELVAKSAPDGYTLLFAYASHTIVPILSGKVGYDPAGDFAGVAQVATQPLLLTVSMTLPVNSVKELIAMAKAKPGMIRGAAPGVGGTGHLAAEIFKLETGTDITTILYKGGAPAQLALVQGEVHFIFATTGSAMAQIKGGKVKVLATSSAERLSYLPDVPTFAEAGLPGVQVSPWQAILAPVRTPRTIIDKLHAALAVVIKQPDTIERLAATGTDPLLSSPKELDAKIRRELTYFGKVIKAAGIKLEG
jgi:tripartite-type tricarboxylate transporter receptor subunit TctC